MKVLFVVLISIISFEVVNAQIDTSKIFHSSFLKRGFYRTYDEFINNTPSITNRPFAIAKKRMSSKDTTLYFADYVLLDEADTLERLANIWGLCDGINVFVKKNHGKYSKLFQLVQLGPYAFYGKPDNVGILGYVFTFGLVSTPAILITEAVSPNVKVEYDFFDLKGKKDDVFSTELKQLFKQVPSILDSFNNEKNWTPKVKRDYMIKFNNYLLENKIY